MIKTNGIAAARRKDTDVNVRIAFGNLRIHMSLVTKSSIKMIMILF